MHPSRHAQSVETDPIRILGGACVLWMQANEFTTATGVNAIVDRAVGSAQNAVQATGANQPTVFGFSTTTGHRHIKPDGSNDILTSSLSALIGATGRPYFWVVMRASSTATTIPVSATKNTTDAVSYLVVDSPNFRVAQFSSDGTENVFGPAVDTALHLHEWGFKTSGTARYVVDGVAYDGTKSGGIAVDFNRLHLGALGLGAFANFSDAEFHEIVVSNAIPNASQERLFRSYFSRKYRLAIA